MIEALGAPADALVVMDAGIATEANIAWLRENGYRYLAVSRERTRRFDPDLALAIETRSRQTVHVHKVVDAEGGEARLYATPRRGRRRNRASQTASPRAGRDEQAQRRPQAAAHPQEARPCLIGRIAAAPRPTTISTSSPTTAAAAVKLAGTMITHPGVYCLRTNVQDWDEETRRNTSLTDVEAVFRSLKSELGLRPIFHQTQSRSDGHPSSP